VDAHRVWADVDLDALAQNLDVIRERTGRGVQVMLVVKADAYGLGAVAVAHHAVRCGVAFLGVGTSAEALELRASGVRARILVLGTLIEAEVDLALRHGIEIGVHSADRIRLLAGAARRLGLRARVHLNVDTGMGRLGVHPERALALLRAIHDTRALELAGVMTHVTSSEGALASATGAQLDEFDRVLADARERDLRTGAVHVANSACVFSGLGRRYDVVRPGIAAYGVLPAPLPGADELRPVLSLRAQVVFLKDFAPGRPIGYEGTWVSSRPSRIATLPLGYADGLPLGLSRGGEVLVRGRRAPFAGRVSMDYATVDVTDVPDVRVGDRVTIVGRDGTADLPLALVSERAGTIPYDVLCSIGRRVSRLYLGAEPARSRAAQAGVATEGRAPVPGAAR
jgi:alanine racemase